MDVTELGVAVFVLATLPGLGICLQAVARCTQQPSDSLIRDRMPLRGQCFSQRPRRLRRPPQRRHRITPRYRINQGVQSLGQARIDYHRGLTTPARSPGTTRLNLHRQLQIGQTLRHRRTSNTSDLRHRSNPTPAQLPGLAEALDALVDPVTRGDPMSALRWTAKSTRTLAETLTAQGHPVSDQTVAGLLRAAGYSLQANSKTREGRQHEDR